MRPFSRRLSSFLPKLMFPALIAALACAPATFAKAADGPGPGDPAAGKKASEFLCRNCHDVTGNVEGKSPPGGAPTFFEVANKAETTPEKLHRFLGLPHGRMINVLLSGKEIDHVVAYILSFKRK